MPLYLGIARLARQMTLSVLLVPLCFVSAAAQGQSEAAHASHQPPVCILGVQGDSSIGRGRVVLRGNGTPAVVILVPLTASPSDLAEAFTIVRMMRHRPTKRDSTVLQRVDLASVGPRHALSADEQRIYSIYLHAFDKAPLITIPGAGRGRAVRTEMPN